MEISNRTSWRFRSPIWSGLVAVLSGILLVWLSFIPLCIFLAPRFRYPAWNVYLGVCLGFTAIGLIFGVFSVFLYTITVRDSGIYGYNLWGNYSWLEWEEMTGVRPIRYVGLPYLRLFFVGSPTPLWIPLFLVNQHQFNQIVIEYAPEANPLKVALLNIQAGTPLAKLTTAPTAISAQTPPKQPLKFAELTGRTAAWLQQQGRSLQSFCLLLLNPPKLFRAIHSSLTEASQQPPQVQPWMLPTIFPEVPIPNSFGYQKRQHNYQCSQTELTRRLAEDPLGISLVWTPDSTHLQVPEEIPFLTEAVQTRKRSVLKQQQPYVLFNVLLFGGLLLATVRTWNANSQMMLLYFVAFGLIPLFQNVWQLHQLNSLTPTTLPRMVAEVRYWRWIRQQRAPWTRLLLGCLAVVGTVQLTVGIWFLSNPNLSPIMTAGIVKPAIWQGEVWRLLTGTLLHGNIIHFIFNFLALMGLGKLVEVLTHAIYVPLVFLISAFAGSVLSLLLLPHATSVGASGGILGLLGFLVILAVKQRKYLPSNFVRLLLIDVIYIAATGLLAYQVIDNAAHFGGFMAGLLLGAILLPNGKSLVPLQISRTTKVSGAIASLAIFSVMILCILKMFGR